MATRPAMPRTIRGACHILGINPDDAASMTVADVVNRHQEISGIMASIERHPEVSDQLSILKKTQDRARIKLIAWLETLEHC